MLRCTLGERKSGKSVFIEEQVKRIDKEALYIATLPDLNRYKETIRAHQRRRPSSWECIELFKMPIEEMLAYPYENYQNVILDNLSYYILFQLYFNADGFLRRCDEKIFSLIDRAAGHDRTMFYMIDTPIHRDVLEEDDETGIVRRLFTRILDKAMIIERFYKEDTVRQMSPEEGKKYLFHT